MPPGLDVIAPSPPFGPDWAPYAILATTFVAALSHGTLGFGFPLLSTPVIALFTDVRSAVLVTLLPNLVVNVLSIVRGSQWRTTLRAHWTVAAYVLLGTLLGSQLLLRANADALRLLLAAMIVVYLLQGRRRHLASWPAGLARLAPAIFGFLGGFFSGTVNVALPPLLVYFSALQLPAQAMTQALNLCFLTGKATQAAALAAAGQWRAELLAWSVPLCLLAPLGVRLGMWVQTRIPARSFLRLMRTTLWCIAAMLTVQVLRTTLP